MKDLYNRLGIEPQSSAEEVAAALESKPELSAVASILLNPHRRAEYDETHQVLTTIGVLRNRLGLDTGHSWFLRNCRDFAPRKSLPFAQKPPGGRLTEAKPPENTRESPAPSKSASRPPPRASKALPLVLAVVGLAAAVLLIAWLVN